MVGAKKDRYSYFEDVSENLSNGEADETCSGMVLVNQHSLL
jgi:hypothetical protein